MNPSFESPGVSLQADAPDLSLNNHFLSTLVSKKIWAPHQPLRLHLGCGEVRLAGFVNVDYPQDHHPVMKVQPDIETDLLEMQLPVNSVDEIELHHVFEHFSRVAALAMLIRWQQWLKVGGTLTIETPDFEGSAQAFLSEQKWPVKTAIIRHLTGDQAAGWAYHVDQWFKAKFERTLSKLGFKDITCSRSRWEHEPYLANITARATKAREISIQELSLAAEELLYESTVAPCEKKTHQTWCQQLRAMVAGAAAPTPLNTTLVNHEASLSQIADLATQLPLQQKYPPLEEITEFEQRTCARWIESKTRELTGMTRVLELSCGGKSYRGVFSGGEFLNHDLTASPTISLADNSVDLVLCVNTIGYVREPQTALLEMRRVLKPGGTLLIADAELKDPTDHSSRSKLRYGRYSRAWYQAIANELNLQLRETRGYDSFLKDLAARINHAATLITRSQALTPEQARAADILFGNLLPTYLFGLENEILGGSESVSTLVHLTKD